MAGLDNQTLQCRMHILRLYAMSEILSKLRHRADRFYLESVRY